MDDNVEVEEWKDVKGFEKIYEVSNLGRIKSNITNKILNPLYNKRTDDYYVILYNSSLKNKKKRFRVNKLVAVHFLENPDNRQFIIHLDNNYTNCKVNNLRWVKNRIFTPRINKNKVIDKLEGEQWKDMIGLETKYEISDHGRVRSKLSNKIKVHTKSEYDNSYKVMLANGSKTDCLMRAVNKLVATHFIDNPENKKYIEHLDDDPSNCKASNLRWTHHPYIYGIKKKTIDCPAKTEEIEKVQETLEVKIDHNKPEEWKCLNEPYDMYEVSSKANVRNRKTGKTLKQHPMGGYMSVDLNTKRFKVHRLVAEYFIENKDKAKIQVDHKDNNKLNNDVDNLQWATQSENISNFYKYYKKEPIKPILQYDLNGNLVKEWKNIHYILRANSDFTANAIRQAINEQNNTAYGYVWGYKYDVKNNVELKSDEIFKNIGMFEGKDLSNYEVSNYGNIRNKKTGRILRKSNNDMTYFKTHLYNKLDDKCYNIFIHRLVAHQFVDGRSETKCVVNHLDENKVNNYYKNLEWTTSSGNRVYSIAYKKSKINIV
jgi:hypothetical protein